MKCVCFFRVWNKVSSSGKYRAIVRKVPDKKKDEKFYLEVIHICDTVLQM